jgi:hypothetical protein
MNFWFVSSPRKPDFVATGCGEIMGFTPEKREEAAEAVNKLKKSSNFDADYVAAQLDQRQRFLKI